MTAPETTAVAKVKAAPVTPSDTLRVALAPSTESLTALGVDPRQYIEAALIAATKEPKLFRCTPESLMLALKQCAQTGLTLGRTAHLLPFGTTATFCPDYKGLIELAMGSGKVASIRTRAVYANEVFSYYEDVGGPVMHHEPKLSGDRGPIIGAYAIADLRFNRFKVEWMTRDDIEVIRRKSQSWSSGSLDDKDWYARKTVVRRLCKTLPQSKQLQAALTIDAEADGIPDGEMDIVPNDTPRVEAANVQQITAGPAIVTETDISGMEEETEFPLATDEERAALLYPVNGVRIGDMSEGKLTALDAYCKDNPKKPSTPAVAAAVTLAWTYHLRVEEARAMSAA
jgi:recombination protein RecT